MIRPSRQPCSLLTGGRFRRADRLPDDPLGVFDHEQRSAGRPIDCVRRFMTADVAATQNAAPPTPSCATTSSPSPTR